MTIYGQSPNASALTTNKAQPWVKKRINKCGALQPSWPASMCTWGKLLLTVCHNLSTTTSADKKRQRNAEQQGSCDEFVTTIYFHCT